MSDQARYEVALARQAVVHHRKREEQLERVLAGLLTAARRKCRCRACRQLRRLDRELREGR